jgi:cytoskeletal protein CcmA (bactofilin family)
MFNRKPTQPQPQQAEPEIIFEGRRALDETFRVPPPPVSPSALAETYAAPLPVPPGPAARDLGPAIPGTVIGADTVLEGTIRAAGSLRIEGHVVGTVIADRVMLGEEGRVEGQIEAGSVRIAGEVKGTVNAREIDVLRPARVDAEMNYVEIAIERGARVRGMHKQREEAPPAPMSTSTSLLDPTDTRGEPGLMERTVIVGLEDLKNRMAQLADVTG